MSVCVIQKQAPDFYAEAVIDGEFRTISLKDFRGKYVVLFFYPLDFTFVCPTEIIAFSDRIAEFRALDCEVIGCSVDSHFCHLAWTKLSRKEGGLGECNIPLVSDITKAISKDYEVLIEEGDAAGVSLRGLFIISPTGILRQKTVNDLPVGRSVDEVLRLVKAFKFTDEHGEVCPANWKPGMETMKPDPNGALEYFAKQ
mmetsp:Transcript_28284/g.61978  ORF Transcript_28284/g.61978 Transcript_28284/m.61978 type:complete len:199 (-) Transcript_28284:63-659(-)